MDDRQLEMQTQRLLEDDGLELAPSRQQPLDLHVPRPGRKVKRSSLTPARFCIGLCSLVGLLIFSAICYGLYGAFRSAGRPHEANHANQTLLGDPGRENELVRPFFGPPASGAPLAMFDLGLLVHARWDVEMESERNTTTEPGQKLPFVSYRPKNATAHVDVWRKLLSDGEGLSMRPFKTGPWRELHRSIVLKDVPLETRPVQTTVPIRFPQEIIRSLVNQTAQAEVVASFFMLPPAGWESSLLRSDDAHPAKVVSTRVQLQDGQTSKAAERLPPVWSSPSSADGPLAELLSRAVAYEELKHERGLLNETDSWSQTYDVRSRVWVTTPRDFAVYNLTSFRGAMRQQKEYLRGACNEGRDRKSPSCCPVFSQSGHFEHLLQVNGSTEADARQWYAPSLIADLGEASAKDYVPLPVFRGNVSDADVEDFLFDYRITFSPSSVRKLAILQHVLHKAIQIANIEPPRHNQTDYARASDYDSAEFWNAIRGHPFEPGTRPVARGLLAFVAGLLGLLTGAVQLFFFLTRTLTTGLSMPALALDQANDFCWAVVGGFRFYMHGDGSLVIVLGVVGFSLVPICAVANLALRLEWSWGGPLGWVPVGITRRRPTHSERASARADARFIWRDRAIFLTVCFLLFAYGPSPPQIIASSPPSAKSSTPSSSFLSRMFTPLIGPLIKTAWWSTAVSQLHLNWRLKSFGESKLYRAMCFAKAVLDWIPIVFHARLGRAELMEALTLRAAVKMCANGAFVYQAWLYPSVPQEEAEDE